MSIRLDQVRKTFEAHGQTVVAVDSVSLDIREGELVTFLGPSGCGKTTTLRMIAGFEEVTSGSIHIGARDVTRLPPQARDTPMVFQSYALFPHLSVRDNALFGLRAKNVAPATANARVEAMAKTMGLSQLLSRGAGELSGGQQQRVALLRALVTEPTVLLFDEPLSNLDVQLRVSLRTEIRALQKRLGITAVYVTHDQAEAMTLSDRVVVMHAGRIAQVSPPQELYFRPVSRFVAEFVGEANFLPVVVRERNGDEAIVETPWGREVASIPAGEDAQASQWLWVVRPESLSLEGQGGGLRATLRSATYLGADWLCEVQLGAQVLKVRAHASPGAAYEPGAEVSLYLSPQRRALVPAGG